jgi:4-amino-4-deoxy-L-arabinose transferase-like glycosyltransferase
MTKLRLPRFSFYLLLGLVLGLGLRVIILTTDAVPFNSDEAVVALMARHTLQGDWPSFFYGQSYMGSLDATLIAAAFAVLGESVLVIRLVQTALFLGIAATTYIIGMRFFNCHWRAGVSLLLIAIPSVLMSTYTTATLGGYGEILLLGNLVLLTAHAVATDRPDDWRAWAGLGAAAGLGFWTSALISVYLLPAAVLILWRSTTRSSITQSLKGILIAGIAFLLLSSPWWWHNLTHDWGALRFMLTGTESSGIGIQSVSLSLRLRGLLLLGVPALLGMRFPWSADFISLPLSVLALTIYFAAVLYAWHRRRQIRTEQGLLLGMMATFAALFLLSRFGTDATGRYFLPLAVPLALWTADLLYRVRSDSPLFATLGLLFLLGFNLLGNGLAIQQTPPGLTTQFDASNRFDNQHDDDLIAFLREIDVTRGYSNYFVAFRIAFLSDEQIILSSQLPYKPDLSYNPADDRYPSYTAQVDRADEVVYITTIHPILDALLAERLSAAQVTYSERQIGPYHLFYDLTRPIKPQELGFGHP